MKKYQRIVAWSHAGPGHKTFTISYHGKQLKGMLTIMPLFDLWKSEARGWKDAGNRIYDIIKGQNCF